MTDTRTDPPAPLASLLDRVLREALRRRLERARELSERSAVAREEREPVGGERQ